MTIYRLSRTQDFVVRPYNHVVHVLAAALRYEKGDDAKDLLIELTTL